MPRTTRLSVDSLVKLMRIRQSLSDQRTVQQIQEILKPLEHTRVDRLVDIIFSTSEDVQSDELIETADSPDAQAPQRASKPVSYHDQCLEKISKHLKAPLVRQGRCTYGTADGKTRVICIVSKEYKRGNVIRYWYAFRPSHKEFLEEAKTGYVALGCGSPEMVAVIPFEAFAKQLSTMRKTESEGRSYWHVEIFKKGKNLLLNTPTDGKGVDVALYLV